ncbi:MAG: hypothetical protein AABX11_03480 [Nanoarchaeota archaeon]
MIEVTDEQRNAVDKLIRDIFYQKFLAGPVPENLPFSAIIGARMDLGWGLNLENACPYARDCNHKEPNLCLPHPNYRGCSFYKIRLAGEVAAGSLDLVALGLG